jgi:hypothetical protein
MTGFNRVTWEVEEGKKRRFAHIKFQSYISTGESPLLPLFVPNRQCHSELINHTQLHIPSGIKWINEESHLTETNQRAYAIIPIFIKI